MIRGSCCCKAVEFELTSTPTIMGTCHCTRCRKVGASSFVIVRKDSFRWIRGADQLRKFEPVPPYKYSRTFCGHCGTSLGEAGSDAESFPIPVNCLDDDPGIANRFHEYVSEKPGWYEICDSAKQFPGDPKAN